MIPTASCRTARPRDGRTPSGQPVLADPSRTRIRTAPASLFVARPRRDPEKVGRLQALLRVVRRVATRRLSPSRGAKRLERPTGRPATPSSTGRQTPSGGLGEEGLALPPQRSWEGGGPQSSFSFASPVLRGRCPRRGRRGKASPAISLKFRSEIADTLDWGPFPLRPCGPPYPV